MATKSTSELIKTFENGPQRFSRTISGLSSAQLTKRPSTKEWSIQEVLAHMADNAIFAAWRLRWVIAEDNPTLVPYDEKA